MKKLLCLFTLCLCIVSCDTNHVAIDLDGFKSIMEEAGLNVVDATNQYEVGTVEGVLIAYNESFQLEFYIVPSVDQSKNAYEGNKADFESIESNTSSHKEVSMGNYSTYSRTTDDLFTYISRTDNTFLYVVADKTYKDDIEELIELLGY